MAQRHAALVPLASDHFNGLALALRLQEGKRAPAGFWSNDVKFQAGYVVSFFEKELRHHFVVEEKVLFPAVNQLVEDARPIIGELITDHRAIESLMKKFCELDTTTLAQDLVNFGKLLEQHIRKEDRQLFPLIESKAPADVLERLSKDIHGYYPSNP